VGSTPAARTKEQAIVILWLILGAITLAVVAALLRPLLVGPKAFASRAAYDLLVYRDQLAEVKRDAARGVLGPAEVLAATREIQRRMLATSSAEDAVPESTAAAAQATMPGQAARRWTAYGIAAALPIAALVIYLAVGSPGSPDAPFASREQAVGAGAMPDIDVALPRLEAELKANPNDLRGWVLLARSYQMLGRGADAVAAFKHAAELAPDAPTIGAAYGESMVLQSGGAVTPEAQKIFERALTQDARNVPARFYLGLAQAQAGNGEAALRTWLGLAAEAPKDAPWLPALQEQIERVAQQFNLDPQKLMPKLAPETLPPGAAPEPGPSAADVAAAAGMTQAERAAMIQGMVDRLATHLAAQPDDLDGWRRIARAYIVLGERDKAIDALSHAAKLAPDDALIARALDALKAEH
jgi:cytochrome c-type biogenesis protein CcmH